jgi:hypothetical protein
MASPANSLRLQDINLYSSGYDATATDYNGYAVGGMIKALPAAAASNYTGYIDSNAAGNHTLEYTEVIIDVPAIAAHTDSTKYVTLELTHGTTTSPTAVVTSAPTIKIVGVTSTGTSAAQYRFRIPPGLNRYIAFKQTVDSGAGTLTASNITYRVAVGE